MFKTLTRIGLAGLMALTSLAHAAETAPESLRIGYQKGSVSMVLAKSHQLLEKRFPDTKFSWVEFPAGPQMLEALNVGSIDLGSTGDIPPIFARPRERTSSTLALSRQSLRPKSFWCLKTATLKASPILKAIRSLSRKVPAHTTFCYALCKRPGLSSPTFSPST